MTPKTQYQKMRDNRARRESYTVNMQPSISVHLPRDPEPGYTVRVSGPSTITAASYGGSTVTLEDGSTLTASAPVWYPDNSGQWVEVPDDCMECPVGPDVELQYLLYYDRKGKSFCDEAMPASKLAWNLSPDDWGRIVAYKVIA